MDDTAANADAPPVSNRHHHSRLRRNGAGWGHLAVSVAGAGLLAWQAQPTSGEVTESLPNAGGWQLLICSAVLLGVAGGAVEGLLLRAGRAGWALVALLLAAVPGLWLPILTLGRWRPDQHGDQVATGRLVAALAGWLLTMLLAAVLAAVAVRRRRGRAS